MASLKMVAAMVMLCMAVASLGAEAAITCSLVTSKLGPCIPYVKEGGSSPPPAACCDGVKALNSAAQTTTDRQTACNCIKSAAASISGFNYDVATGIPAKCGVSIPYKISPSTDCSKVQ